MSRTLAELWSEKKTPTIRVRSSLWKKDPEWTDDTEWYCVVGFTPKGKVLGYWSGESEDTSEPAEDDKPVWSLWAEPPTPRRVYQALFRHENRSSVMFRVSDFLYESEEDARNGGTGTFIRLIQPGFEVPE